MYHPERFVGSVQKEGHFHDGVSISTLIITYFLKKSSNAFLYGGLRRLPRTRSPRHLNLPAKLAGPSRSLCSLITTTFSVEKRAMLKQKPQPDDRRGGS